MNGSMYHLLPSVFEELIEADEEEEEVEDKVQ